MGGTDGNNDNYRNSCEAYNTSKDEWTYIESMKRAKDVFSAIVVNNQYIYTFGGYD